MKIKSLKYFLFAVFVCIFSKNNAQNNNDFRAWSSLEISGNLSKKLEISLKAQSRFNQQFTQPRGIYYSLDASRKIKKKWSLEGGLRYKTSRTFSSLRIRMGISKKFKLNKIDLSIRGFYQIHWDEFGLHENYGNIRVLSWRFRFQVERKIIKHLILTLSSEPLWRAENKSVFLRRVRNSLGLSYEIDKKMSVEASYLFQPQFNPYRKINILSLSISYDISPPKKKK